MTTGREPDGVDDAPWIDNDHIAGTRSILDHIAAAGARRLVATHIYDQFDQPGIREKVIAEMSRVYDGVIVIGEDLMQLSLKPETPGTFR